MRLGKALVCACIVVAVGGCNANSEITATDPDLTDFIPQRDPDNVVPTCIASGGTPNQCECVFDSLGDADRVSEDILDLGGEAPVPKRVLARALQESGCA